MFVTGNGGTLGVFEQHRPRARFRAGAKDFEVGAGNNRMRNPGHCVDMDIDVFEHGVVLRIANSFIGHSSFPSVVDRFTSAGRRSGSVLLLTQIPTVLAELLYVVMMEQCDAP